MNCYYFIFGNFSPTQYGYNYDFKQEFYEVYANSYDEAHSLVYQKCTEKHGKQDYKDMWYGVEAFNWKLEPRSKHYFEKLSNGKNIITICQE